MNSNFKKHDKQRYKVVGYTNEIPLAQYLHLTDVYI